MSGSRLVCERSADYSARVAAVDTLHRCLHRPRNEVKHRMVLKIMTANYLALVGGVVTMGVAHSSY